MCEKFDRCWRLMRISLIGPVYPYRGGIAHHTALLAKHLGERHDVQLISFRRQYPRWLFPGHTDRDPSMAPIRSNASFLLDPLNPLTWWAVARQVRAWRPDALILPWWVPFWAPPWLTLSRLTHRWTKLGCCFCATMSCPMMEVGSAESWRDWFYRPAMPSSFTRKRICPV